MEDSAVIPASLEAAPTPRRFDFVHNLELRPVLEQAYTDSRRAVEQGDFRMALITSCGILEAIVTDALEHRGLSALPASGVPAQKWPIGRSKRGLPLQKVRDSFAAGAPVCQPSRGPIEITVRAARRRRYPSAMREGWAGASCRDERSGSWSVGMWFGGELSTGGKSIFQVLPKHRLEWIDAAVDNGHEQVSVCAPRLLE